MRKFLWTLLLLGALGYGGSHFIFIVNELDMAVATDFGKPVGEPKVQPGFYFKLPWQKITVFDKRLQRWDGEATEIPTKDKKYIFAEVTARWRIKDPLKFLQAVGADQSQVRTHLDDIIDSIVGQIVTRHTLIELVRGSNDIIPKLREARAAAGDFAAGASQDDDLLRPIQVGREGIMKQTIEAASSKLGPDFGIEVRDVIIKRINYIEDVRQNVYNRMQAERNKIAQKYRSEGEGNRVKKLGEMEREIKRIQSEAYQKAREIMGTADAEAASIYALAYGADPEFFAFYRTLDAYRDSLGAQAHLVLDADSEFLRYLRKAGPLPPPPPLPVTAAAQSAPPAPKPVPKPAPKPVPKPGP